MGPVERPSGSAAPGRRTFSALSIRNFRLYMIGQLVSVTGTFLQTVALAVLVLQITGKGTAVGVVFALQYLPTLVLAPIGGAIADRVDNRRALYATQTCSCALALALGLLVASGAIQMWMVYGLAFGLGVVNALDGPIRQTFIFAMVGADELTNAVSLYSVMAYLARVIGPALGGVTIALFGVADCFFANAASYVAVLLVLFLIRSEDLHLSSGSTHSERGVGDALRYVRATPELLVPLVMLTILGTFSWAFPVSLPLLAKFTFHRGSGLFSALLALFSLGGAAGALFLASRREHPGARGFSIATGAFGITTLIAAVAPSVTLALIAIVLVGIAGLITMAGGQSLIQLTTDPTKRGRVMALFMMATVGTSAVGGPIIGWISDRLGPRYALGTGGVAAIVAALLGYLVLLRPGRAIARDASSEHAALLPEILDLAPDDSAG